MKLLFVCTGNTCRSCMAEALTKLQLKLKNINKWELSSAGTSTLNGLKASDMAIEVISDMGGDLKNHRSTALNTIMVDKADLVLTMTDSHKRAILDFCPKSKEKVYTLGEYVGKNIDIPDPYGFNREIYQACAKALEDMIIALVDKLS